MTFIRSTASLFLLVGTLAATCGAQSFQDVEQCLDSAWRGPDAAIQDCTKAIDAKVLTDYELVHSLNSRAWAYRRKQDYDRAIQDYDRAIQLKPDYAEAFNGRGLAYYGKKEYNLAIQDYSEAIRLKPEYPEAFNNRGLACLSSPGSCDSGKAIADFDQAIELQPDFAEAFFNRGDARDSDGHFKSAIPDYTEAIHMRPDYAEAFVQRSEAYEYMHDTDHALQDLNQAIKLKPDDSDAISRRASLYENDGDHDRAIRDFTEVIHLKPDDLEPVWFRAMAYYDNGNYGQSIWDLNRIIEAQPEINSKTVNYIHQRGLARLYGGDYVGAIADFEEVGKIYSWDVYREGLARFYMGKFKAAETDFDRGEQYVWAYLAASRAGENAEEKLRRINSQDSPSSWPGAVAHFYLGSISAAQLLSAAKRDDLQDKSASACACDQPNSASAHNKYHTHQSESAAYFYLGERELLSGHPIEARGLFQKSIATGTKNNDEYQGALVELHRIKVSYDLKPALK